ncbi:hypothetical protein CL629_04135 [bacterium]|nr:hypothetical protein [bacterium]|tara:strand:- start:1143 stop:1817 length:675 start_codon:yes stop_codon:yes gene_type:complete
MPRYNPQKEKATKMRDAGYSYNLISEKLDITKSTLSNWFKDRPFAPNKRVLGRIRYAPARGGAVRHNRRMEETSQLKQEGKREVGNLTRRDLFLLGLGIYIGEGSKSYEFAQVINSDPRIIKLAIRWFQDACGVPLSHIKVLLYLYPDNKTEECIRYWIKVTNLPASNFQNPIIDARTNKLRIKRRKLPYGTARITIVSKGKPEFGVRLHRKIMGWIEGALPDV